MDRENRIVIAHRRAGIDDLLGAPLHFRIAPLHGVKVERFLIRTGLNR